MFAEFLYRYKNDVCAGDVISYRTSWATIPNYPMLVIEKRYDKASLSKKLQNIVGATLYCNADGLCWTALRHDGHMIWFDYDNISRKNLWVIFR